MKLTNKHTLPRQYVEFVERTMDFAPPEPNVYRATQIMKGVKETLLWRRYYDKIEADVSEFVWAVLGTAVHSIFEQSKASHSELQEERLYVSIGDKYTLTGKPDLYCAEDKLITDWKVTSAWKIIYKNFDDWYKQLCIYKLLFESYGFPVEQGKITALLRDHTPSKAKYDTNYPALPFHIQMFDLKDNTTDTWIWVLNRFDLIREYEEADDNDIPACTPEERWATPDKWAVMKKGRKSALRVLDSEEEAEAYIKEKGGEYIEHRVGEDRKCQDYCMVNKFCNYWRCKYEG